MFLITPEIFSSGTGKLFPVSLPSFDSEGNFSVILSDLLGSNNVSPSGNDLPGEQDISASLKGDETTDELNYILTNLAIKKEQATELTGEDQESSKAESAQSTSDQIASAVLFLAFYVSEDSGEGDMSQIDPNSIEIVAVSMKDGGRKVAYKVHSMTYSDNSWKAVIEAGGKFYRVEIEAQSKPDQIVAPIKVQPLENELVENYSQSVADDPESIYTSTQKENQSTEIKSDSFLSQLKPKEAISLINQVIQALSSKGQKTADNIKTPILSESGTEIEQKVKAESTPVKYNDQKPEKPVEVTVKVELKIRNESLVKVQQEQNIQKVNPIASEDQDIQNSHKVVESGENEKISKEPKIVSKTDQQVQVIEKDIILPREIKNILDKTLTSLEPEVLEVKSEIKKILPEASNKTESDLKIKSDTDLKITTDKNSVVKVPESEITSEKVQVASSKENNILVHNSSSKTDNKQANTSQIIVDDAGKGDEIKIKSGANKISVPVESSSNNSQQVKSEQLSKNVSDKNAETYKVPMESRILPESKVLNKVNNNLIPKPDSGESVSIKVTFKELEITEPVKNNVPEKQDVLDLKTVNNNSPKTDNRLVDTIQIIAVEEASKNTSEPKIAKTEMDSIRNKINNSQNQNINRVPEQGNGRINIFENYDKELLRTVHKGFEILKNEPVKSEPSLVVQKEISQFTESKQIQKIPLAEEGNIEKPKVNNVLTNHTIESEPKISKLNKGDSEPLVSDTSKSDTKPVMTDFTKNESKPTIFKQPESVEFSNSKISIEKQPFLVQKEPIKLIKTEQENTEPVGKSVNADEVVKLSDSEPVKGSVEKEVIKPELKKAEVDPKVFELKTPKLTKEQAFIKPKSVPSVKLPKLPDWGNDSVQKKQIDPPVIKNTETFSKPESSFKEYKPEKIQFTRNDSGMEQQKVIKAEANNSSPVVMRDSVNTTTVSSKPHTFQNMPPAAAEPEIVPQIVKQAVFENVNGRSSMLIKLDPPSLGTVKLDMVYQNEQLVARVIVAGDSAKQVIEQKLPELHQSLLNQGIHVAKLEVHTVGNTANNSGFGMHHGSGEGGNTNNTGNSSSWQDSRSQTGNNHASSHNNNSNNQSGSKWQKEDIYKPWLGSAYEYIV